MPNLKTPKQKIKKKAQAPVERTPAERASTRLVRITGVAGDACLRFCRVVERFKATGVTATDIEVELGIDAGDLESHFEACALVAENADLNPPTWS